MDQNEVREAATLLRERADLMETFSGDVREIKITLTLADHFDGSKNYVEHFITADYFRDMDDHDKFWDTLRERIGAIDERLRQLGISVTEIGNSEKAQ